MCQCQNKSIFCCVPNFLGEGRRGSVHNPEAGGNSLVSSGGIKWEIEDRGEF